MKIRSQNQAITAESFVTPVNKSRFIDALVIHAPDLSLYLKMQNLMNYFLDCLKDVLVPTDTFSTNVKNIELCVQHIEQLFEERQSEFNTEIRKTMNEFVDEISQFRKLVKVFFGEDQNEWHSGPADVLLSAKFSRLQWLSVCILEELRHPFSRDSQ